MKRLPLTTLLLLCVACDNSTKALLEETVPAPAATNTTSAEHSHEAPHGGTMIQLGDHFANVEFLVNDKKGELHVWFHDAHAQNSYRLAAQAIPIGIALEDGTHFDLMLKPVANVLTGETPGNTSQFSGKDSNLVGCKAFRGLLTPVSIQGRSLPALDFGFPSGNVMPAQTMGRSR